MRLEYEVYKRSLHAQEFFRAAEFAIKHVLKDERLHKTRMETFNAIIASYVGTHQNEGSFIKTILGSLGKRNKVMVSADNNFFALKSSLKIDLSTSKKQFKNYSQ
ncbi:hypothetical protein B1A99_26730 [Cohnella sp. CIP 111063]|nr:hypothetical protein B1A99_26730 [Cohnella sp. CIP 111063]